MNTLAFPAQYRFHATWNVPAERSSVREVLLDAERYPLWWPQVRSVKSTCEGMLIVCRSLLPYDLTFYSVQMVLEDGTLAAQLCGDLDGVAHVRMYENYGGTRIEYEQEVTLEKRWLKTLSPALRPAFRFNHALMMRDGEAGLRKYVAGFATGRM